MIVQPVHVTANGFVGEECVQNLGFVHLQDGDFTADDDAFVLPTPVFQRARDVLWHRLFGGFFQKGDNRLGGFTALEGLVDAVARDAVRDDAFVEFFAHGEAFQICQIAERYRPHREDLEIRL